MKIRLAFVLILSAILCMAAGGIGMVAVGGAGLKQTVRTSGAAMLEEGGKLRIRSDMARIRIEAGAGDQVEASLTGSFAASTAGSVRLDVQPSKDGVVQVEAVLAKHKFVSFPILDLYAYLTTPDDERPTLIIKLPAKKLAELTIETDIGSIDLPGVTADSVRIASDTGNISLDNGGTVQTYAKTSTGSIRITEAEGTVDASSDTGSVHVGIGQGTRSVHAESDTGSIVFTAKTDSQPFQFDFESDTGRTGISRTGPNIHYSVNEKHRVTGTFGKGGPLLKAKSDTGGISVE